MGKDYDVRLAEVESEMNANTTPKFIGDTSQATRHDTFEEKRQKVLDEFFGTKKIEGSNFVTSKFYMRINWLFDLLGDLSNERKEDALIALLHEFEIVSALFHRDWEEAERLESEIDKDEVLRTRLRGDVTP